MNDLERLKYISQHFNKEKEAEYYFKPSASKTIGGGWLRNRELAVAMSFLTRQLTSGRLMVLDIGCASGRYLRTLLNRRPECTGVGIDTAGLLLHHARQAVPEGSFLQASVTGLPFKDKKFDLVLCIGLFHHLPSTIAEAGLEEISRVLKPGGVFVFDFKNRLNPYLWWLYARKENDKYTLRTTTPWQVTKLARQKGFRIVKRAGIPSVPLLAPEVIVCAVKA